MPNVKEYAPPHPPHPPKSETCQTHSLRRWHRKQVWGEGGGIHRRAPPMPLLTNLGLPDVVVYAFAVALEGGVFMGAVA